MTETEKRQSVADIMIGWKGRKESDGSHKLIIDIYNDHKPLAQNYRVQYTDSWCMTAASAAYIKAGLADIFPLECSCTRAIEKAKKMGIWVENDAYVPKIADAVLYDWQDNGIGDNTGNPDHVGLVTAVKGNKIEVMEGNKHDAVAERTIEINQRYIRGYIAPKFSGDSTSAPATPSQPAKTETKPATSTVTTSTVLKKGSKGSAVGTMQTIEKDLYGIPNVLQVIYTKNNEHYETIVKNTDSNSPVSIQNRGREITKRLTDPDIGGVPTKEMIDDYAKSMLKSLSTLEYTISYTHGYCPVRVGDCVRFMHPEAGLKDVKAKVISQSISCSPGCSVTEKATYTVKLWG